MIHRRTENLEAGTTPEKHAVESVVVVTLPEEVAYPIRRKDFDTLCEGEMISNDLRWRDVSTGVSAAAFFAIVGLIVGIDWNLAMASRRWLVFAAMVLTVAIFLSGVVLAWILHRRVARHKNGSAYSRLKEEIEEWFRKQGRR